MLKVLCGFYFGFLVLQVSLGLTDSGVNTLLFAPTKWSAHKIPFLFLSVCQFVYPEFFSRSTCRNFLIFCEKLGLNQIDSFFFLKKLLFWGFCTKKAKRSQNEGNQVLWKINMWNFFWSFAWSCSNIKF